MADLNALIAQGYQSQPLPDPFAQYGKMQQLENSATQNRLAQQQMQENAQMAPLRMREMEARLNTSNLTYEQAKGAQDFITGVMQKAKENGSDVSDPIDAAKQMLMHPNPTVQTMGTHLLDAYGKIKTFERQQAYAQSENGLGAGAVGFTGLTAPAAAPTAAYTPQRILVGSQSVEPSALGSGTFDVNAPAPVANAFARTVPSVNAFRPNAVTAESIAAKIDAGDKQFFDVPEWKLQRERLLKQYEALLQPRHAVFSPVDPSKYTPDSIKTFMVSGDQSDLVAITPKNNVFSTLNPKDYTQESIRAFNASGDYADLIPKEKSDKTVGNINAADFTPASVQAFNISGDYSDLLPREKPGAKNEFEQLLDASNMTEDQKAEARRAKIAKETARPEQKAEARSEFEKLLDASDMTEEQKASARRAKITKETAGPADRPESRSEFEKLLDASNMTEEQKAAARNAKIAKETASPADRPEARSEFEKLLDASNMTEPQKAAARLARIAKESTTAAAGGQGKPPTGYRYDKSGENLEVIPGGPADKQEKLKPIPPAINTAIISNDQSINKIQDALNLLQNNKDAIGLKGNLPQSLLNRADTKGIATRAAITDIGSLVLHDRSGAAVTASEEPRLMPFIPNPADTYEAGKTKLERMLKYAKENQAALKGTYSEDQGYKSSPILASGGSRPVPAGGSAINAADAILNKGRK